MNPFQNAKYIWCAGLEDVPNSYVNCLETITAVPGKTYLLYITAHTDYALYNNDTLVTFGQYADYPDQIKIYDTVDITPYLVPGKNNLTITGYCQRVRSSTQREGVPGILYVITEDGTDICHSDLSTVIMQHPCYQSGEIEQISVQLGYTFSYDGTQTVSVPGQAVETMVLPALAPRPIHKLLCKEPCPVSLITNGSFMVSENASVIGKKFMNTGLFPGQHIPNPDFTSGLFLSKPANADGVYAILDLGREEAGLLTLDVETDTDTELLIGWGEHLDDLRVRAAIGRRNFACRVVVPKGRFTFTNPLRRLGCRYLELHAYGSITVHRLSICPTDYPVTDNVSFRCADHMHNEIYETCKRTLLMCMHEHYEDCPWREQALYSMDSRNQMLCGYYTFREFKFAKSSLRLMAQSIRDDSFLELCSPAHVSRTIPAFSAVYMVQLWEYLLFSGDKAFAAEMVPVCERICRMFMSRIAPNGLIPMLQEQQYWNFYEWQDGLAGTIGSTDAPESLTYDLPLNAFVSMGLSSFSKIMDALELDGTPYRNAAAALNTAAHEHFFNPAQGLYYTNINIASGEKFHLAQLSQSLAVCAGICPENALDCVLENLAYNKDLLPVTLSHSIFRYDALLKQPEKYGRYVFDHIAQVFGTMLKQNATTFWETIVGGDDFYYAGSLCHGWSAIPAYLYFRYAVGIYPDAVGHMGEAVPLPVSQTGIYEIHTNF